MWQKIYVEDYANDGEWFGKDEGDVEAELSAVYTDAKQVMEDVKNSPTMKIRLPFAFYRWNQETSQN
jgi:hypothetical protein